MSLPSGLIFFMDFVFSPNLDAAESQTSRFGNLVNKSIGVWFSDKNPDAITGVEWAK